MNEERRGTATTKFRNQKFENSIFETAATSAINKNTIGAKSI